MKFKYVIIDGDTAKVYDDWYGMVKDGDVCEIMRVG